MPMSTESKVTIKIPRALYRRLIDIIDGSGFDSVTDFVVYVLRDIASTAGEPVSNEPIVQTGRDIEKVKKRLKRLGYL